MVENKDKKYNSDKHWELVNFCEFDKYATKSYCAIHDVDESKNLGDITKVDENELDDFNMICGGSPCQDFSVVGKQFKDTTFKLFTDELEEYGYNVYWKVLNAKNYGIPQNRERVYLLFIKKDLDNGKFKFPEPFDNGLRLKDLLEDKAGIRIMEYRVRLNLLGM